MFVLFYILSTFDQVYLTRRVFIVLYFFMGFTFSRPIKKVSDNAEVNPAKLKRMSTRLKAFSLSRKHLVAFGSFAVLLIVSVGILIFKGSFIGVNRLGSGIFADSLEFVRGVNDSNRFIRITPEPAGDNEYTRGKNKGGSASDKGGVVIIPPSTGGGGELVGGQQIPRPGSGSGGSGGASELVSLEFLPITGTFWVLDYPDSTGVRTRALVDDMYSANIDTVIVGGVGSLAKDNNGSYYLAFGGTLFTRYSGVVMKKLLERAQAHGMKVWIGLLTNGENVRYWEGSPTDPNTDMGALLQFSYNAAEEAYNKIQQWGLDWNSLIEGFYVPQEKPVAVLANPSAPDLTFYGALASYLHSRFPGKKVGVSPYLFENTDYATAKAGFINLFNAGYDVIYPQDSIGSGLTTSFEANREHMRALHDAARATGKKAWVNIELFKRQGDGQLVPADFERIKDQIYTAYPYVEKVVSWAFSWDLSTTSALDGLQSYTGQYVAGRLQLRRELRRQYTDYFKVYRVLQAFVYGSNLVLRGYGLAPSSDLTINVNNKTWSGDVSFTSHDYGDDIGYVALTRLATAGINNSDLVNIQPWQIVYTMYANSSLLDTDNQDNQVDSYTDTTGSTNSSPMIDHVFVYGNNLVVKGRNFGESAAVITVTLGAAKFGDMLPVYKEAADTIYIPTSTLAQFGIDPALLKPQNISIKPADGYQVPDIKYFFKWGDNYVVKGYKFQTSSVLVYLGQGGKSLAYNAVVYREGESGQKIDAVYIPVQKFVEAGIDASAVKIQDIRVVPNF